MDRVESFTSSRAVPHYYHSVVRNYKAGSHADLQKLSALRRPCVQMMCVIKRAYVHAISESVFALAETHTSAAESVKMGLIRTNRMCSYAVQVLV